MVCTKAWTTHQTTRFTSLALDAVLGKKHPPKNVPVQQIHHPRKKYACNEVLPKISLKIVPRINYFKGL